MKKVLFVVIALVFSFLSNAQDKKYVTFQAEIANRNGDFIFIRQNKKIIKKIEVDKKVGEQNYCDDCPLFYKKGSNKPISIFKYRKEIEKIYIGDYLMVTVNDGKIKLPKINERKKTEKSQLFRNPTLLAFLLDKTLLKW